MKGNVPVQDQNLSILHVCPKIILCRNCKKFELDFSLQLGIGKSPLEQECSHICHHFHPELLITPRCRKQSLIFLQSNLYTCSPSFHLPAELCNFLHFSLFMLYSLLKKHSSKYFITPFALHVLS